MSKIVILIILLGIIVAIYFYQQYITDSDEQEDIDPPQNVRYINNKSAGNMAYIEKDEESDISGLDSWDGSESQSENNYDDFSLSNMSENNTNEHSNSSCSLSDL